MGEEMSNYFTILIAQWCKPPPRTWEMYCLKRNEGYEMCLFNTFLRHKMLFIQKNNKGFSTMGRLPMKKWVDNFRRGMKKRMNAIFIWSQCLLFFARIQNDLYFFTMIFTQYKAREPHKKDDYKVMGIWVENNGCLEKVKIVMIG